MTHFRFFCCVCIIWLCACAAPTEFSVRESDLPATINTMFNRDQQAVNIRPVDSAVAAYQRAIHANFPTVKAIFKKYGFIGYDKFGVETSERFFLLVQHSDFDVAFQQAVLKKMKPEVIRKNASPENYAFLVDRVEINNGRSQVYGTQINMGIHTTVKPCIDPDNLNQRRQEVGLEPIEAYLAKCNEVFLELNPTEGNQ